MVRPRYASRSSTVNRRALRRSHAALGFHTGVTHTEFRLSANGPRLMEINARLGGNMIPYLGQLATGVDVALAAADVAAATGPTSSTGTARPPRSRSSIPNTTGELAS